MKKITFVNNSEPYLSAENLNQMQENVENAISGVTIWTNSKPTEEFVSQQINIDLKKYKSFQVIWLINPNDNIYISSSIIKGMTFQEDAKTYLYDANLLLTRLIGIFDSYIWFGQCYGYGIANSATSTGFLENTNKGLIPVQIIGFE